MKHFFHNFFISIVTITSAVLSMHDEENTKRFVVVSSWTLAVEFYPVPMEKRSEEEPNLDERKRICRDILGSYEFVQKGQYPYEEEFIGFMQLLRRPQINEIQNYAFKFIRSVLVGGNRKFVNEFAFVCLAQDESGKNITEYYVSTEYNLNSETDDLTRVYFPARFVFHYLSSFHRILGLQNLAETPAKVYPLPDGDLRHIEHLYLDRRKEFIPAYNRKLDALCRLHLADKTRICMAVFNSSYFDGKVEYPHSSIGQVEGKCELKTVSFRMEEGETSAGPKKYEEWVMSCKPDQREDAFDFLLSGAYQDNEILVFFWERTTQQMFVELLSTNVRINAVQWLRRRDPDKTDDNYDYDLTEEDADYLHSE